jgi:hypothetical protein
VLAVVGNAVALPQGSDHVDRLLEHLQADVGDRPAIAEHVLVEVLSRSHSQKEPSGQHRRTRGGCLSDDRGMDPDRGTGHAGPDPEAVGDLSDPPDHRPDEWALALFVDPGVEVIRDEAERETRLFGSRRVADQVLRSMLFAGQLVSEFGHGSLPHLGLMTGRASSTHMGAPAIDAGRRSSSGRWKPVELVV